jgi:hypothetical protein
MFGFKRRREEREVNCRQRVLEAIAWGPAPSTKIADRAGLSAGRIYPILVGLEGESVVVSEWGEETIRRRYYRLAESPPELGHHDQPGEAQEAQDEVVGEV